MNYHKEEIELFEEENLKKIKELEKLTFEELGIKRRKLRREYLLYAERIKEDGIAMETAISARRIIDLYEKEGFKGLYAEIALKKKLIAGRREEGISEDDIPF